jgi:patatin-like phospholipase/acyl hydrolase
MTAGDAALCTSAAPFYLPPLYLNGVPHIDGGTVANDPSEASLQEARRLWPNRQVKIYSIATGWYPTPLDSNPPPTPDRGWGAMTWASNIVDELLNAQETLVNKNMHQLLSKEDYFRFQVLLPSNIPLDDTSSKTLALFPGIADKMIHDEPGKWNAMIEDLKLAAKENPSHAEEPSSS